MPKRIFGGGIVLKYGFSVVCYALNTSDYAQFITVLLRGL